MRKDNKYAFNDSYYKRSYRNAVEGSAARELEAEEEYEEEYEEVLEEQIEEPVRERRTNRNVRPIKEVLPKTKIKRKYQFHPFTTAFLLVTLGVLFFYSVKYIQQKSNINLIEKQIAAAEKQLNDLNAKNAALATQLNVEIDRNFLYTIGVNKFGMQYPNDNQVIKYQTPDQGYVKQYGDIPVAN